MANRNHDPQKLYRRLIRKLKKRGIIVSEKKLRNYHGHVQYSRIVLDSAKTAVGKLRYLIHESLHEIYPDWSETEIRHATALVFKSLSINQLIGLACLYQRLVRRGKRRKNT